MFLILEYINCVLVLVNYRY